MEEGLVEKSGRSGRLARTASHHSEVPLLNASAEVWAFRAASESEEEIVEDSCPVRSVAEDRVDETAEEVVLYAEVRVSETFPSISDVAFRTPIKNRD